MILRVALAGDQCRGPGAMSHSGAASGSAPTTPASPAEGAAAAGSGRQTRKRVERPEIDLDANIRDARATIQRAQAALTQARQQAKADRRKKARLIKKACHLSPADLERIAVLKRCGFSGVERDTATLQKPDPTEPDGAPMAHHSAASGAGSAASSAAASSAQVPAAASSAGKPTGAAADRSPASDVEDADLQVSTGDDPER